MIAPANRVGPRRFDRRFRTTQAMEHSPHAHIEARKAQGVHTIARELTGFNGWLALKITNSVGTMWCAYAFAILALISLPDAIKAGTAALIAWIAQTFLQLVLLSIIMVGQKVAASASDKQAFQTYKDAEALLELSTDMHKLIEINNALTEEIHQVLSKKSPDTPIAAS
jgi:ABC-type nickel/cobalt efflux system permease component RcnA